MYERVRESYDRVAERYAAEYGDELVHKPLERALLRCLAELATAAPDATGQASVGDIGCGPGQASAYLAALGVSAVGIDVSPAMIEVARQRAPQAQFRVGSLLALPATDGELSGAVSLYSIIHLRPEDRATSYAELARVIVPGGWLLLAFYLGMPGHRTDEILHADEWWGERVDLDFHYLDPGEVEAGLAGAGFTVTARIEREPIAQIEHQSRRCYLLGQRG